MSLTGQGLGIRSALDFDDLPSLAHVAPELDENFS